MKYFIDTEFIEGTQVSKCPFRYITGKRITKPTIDLISIALVSEDSREYYAISKDFNLKEAWNRYDIKKEWYSIDELTQSTRDVKVYWIRDNVLKPIFVELFIKDNNLNKETCLERHKEVLGNKMTYRWLKTLINKYGRTNKQIAKEVEDFCKEGNRNYYNLPKGEGARTINEKGEEVYQNTKYCSKPEFYGYYADYDWVVFCWLFGKMINLPRGFPMYCIDLKQESDRIYNLKKEEYTKGGGRNFMNKMSNHLDYPKQTNEHNALADAKWNYELFKFLKKV